MADKISLAQQIEEVQRELAMRAKVYPHQIATRKLKQSHADFYVARMQATLKTLEWLATHEQRIKEMLAECT